MLEEISVFVLGLFTTEALFKVEQEHLSLPKWDCLGYRVRCVGSNWPKA